MLTDLLHGKMRALSLEFLVHGVSEDDPTIHRSGCSRLAESSRFGPDSSLLNGVGLNFELWTNLLLLWHLDESLRATATVHGDEVDGLSHMLDQAAFEILDEHVAKYIFDVELK